MVAASLAAEGWTRLVADVLECSAEIVAQGGATESFVNLGGTSLRAAELVAVAERRLGYAIDLGLLLSSVPVAEVVAVATPCEPVALPDGTDATAGVLLPAQRGMLLAEDMGAGSAFHLLFSVEARGPLHRAALVATLAELTDRHEALRTVFDRAPDGYTRRVLARWAPRLVEQNIAPAPGCDPIAQVHAQLAATSHALLDPRRQPPAVFVLTRFGEQHHLLSLVIHHTAIDGCGIGLLLRELAECYERKRSGRNGNQEEAAPSPDLVLAWGTALERSGKLDERIRRRVEQLAGLPLVLELPTDLQRPTVRQYGGVRLPFGLRSEAQQGCENLARTCGVTRTAVLLAAWALVLSRRTGQPELLVGVPAAARPTAELARVVGLCTRLAPVHCSVRHGVTVREHVAQIAKALATAVEFADVPFDRLVTELGASGDVRRNPLVQVVLAAHDDLVPERLPAGELDLIVHEGSCGGSPLDMTLYVQRWGTAARLVLEYATAVLTPAGAADLAEAFDATLADLAADPDAPIAWIRGMSEAQRSRLIRLGAGAPSMCEEGLWQLVEQQAERTPDAVAVRDADPALVLTYRELVAAAVAQSALLASAGVGVDDSVVLATPRSAAEMVGILAILRLGAAYVALDTTAPVLRLAVILESCAPRAVLGTGPAARRIATLAPAGCAVVDVVDLLRPHSPAGARPAAPADPGRVAYIAFTSGSTGRPKGVRVPHRAVVRLVRNVDYVRSGAGERFLRLAPLAFDASTLELFAPVTSGATIEVYPDGPAAPPELARFLTERRITVLWLTAGLFRVMVDHRPESFATVRQVLTGGDVVPPPQVRALLTRFAGLRITNGYGPTENTTFTTVHHIDDPCEVEDPLPIGRPIPGTGVVVLDDRGELVPPGGLGELCTYGAGLAADYLGAPEETDRLFGWSVPAGGPGAGERLYRIGDLVRWDGDGNLRFLGRRDHQVKIRGFRIELDEVRRALAGHPAVRDAVVVVSGSDAATRRLVAGVVAERRPNLVADLRRSLAGTLPAYAVPALWAVVDAFPTTANGKVDAGALEALAHTRDADPAPSTPAGELAESGASVDRTCSPAPAADLEDVILSVWRDVLDDERVGVEDRFFDVGGDSLRLASVFDRLQTLLPDRRLAMVDVFRHPTVRQLATYLRGAPPGSGVAGRLETSRRPRRPGEVRRHRPEADLADGGPQREGSPCPDGCR